MSTSSTSSNLFSPLRDPESLIRRKNLGELSSLFDLEEVISIPHSNQGPPPAGPPPPNNNGPPPVCMSTSSTSSNLFSPLRDPESLIRRKNLGEPSSLFDLEEVMSIPHSNQGPPLAGPPPPNNNGPPPVVRPNGPAPRSLEELCQPSINGQGKPIALIPIQDTDFRLRHHMIQQVQNTCQFHGLPGDDANRHIDKFLEVTQHMMQNGVSDDALCLSFFPYSLTHHATACARLVVVPILLASAQPSMATLKRSLMLLRVTTIREEVKREVKATKDKIQATSSESTTHVQPPVVQVLILKPEVALKPNTKPSIPYPSRLNDQKLCEKANNQMLKFLQIFQRVHFDISLADALLHMPKFGSTFKSLLCNKEKLFELASIPLNENCFAVLLKKSPKNPEDPT
nr:reverse transcriptase domain-containing protein [Tanacetum cinerariifolium]